MHWSQQAHDNGAIFYLLPNHKRAIRPGQKIGHKTHGDVEGDICHTEALNQGLFATNRRQPSRDRKPQKPPLHPQFDKE